MRISDWSSDVCSSDLYGLVVEKALETPRLRLEGVGLRQVARQHVIERRNVGGALDGAMAAQRDDAAAWPTHVTEQKLDHGGGADHLHPDAEIGRASCRERVCQYV